MNDVLKQRLVGALILVALGVIFWPIIFVQPGDRETEEIQPVPMRPGVAATPVEPPDRVGLRASPETIVADEEPEPEELSVYPPPKQPSPGMFPPPGSAPITGPDRSAPAPDVVAAPAPQEPKPVAKTRSEAPQPLKTDSDGVPVAYILQIASVSNADNARALRDKLISMNYKADTTKVQRGGKTLHRVYLGPKFERAALEKLQPAIDAEFGVTSMITRYVP